jgi:hypothetical protein
MFVSGPVITMTGRHGAVETGRRRRGPNQAGSSGKMTPHRFRLDNGPARAGDPLRAAGLWGDLEVILDELGLDDPVIRKQDFPKIGKLHLPPPDLSRLCGTCGHEESGSPGYSQNSRKKLPPQGQEAREWLVVDRMALPNWGRSQKRAGAEMLRARSGFCAQCAARE